MPLYQEPRWLRNVANLKIYGGKCDDFIDTYYMTKDIFSDNENIKTKEDFKNSYDNIILDVAVARDDKNEIVCASYIFPFGYRAVNFTGYAQKDYHNPAITLECAKAMLRYYFEKYNTINRIDAMGRINNRVSRWFITKLGFKRIGTIPKFGIVGNTEVDYYFSTLLREEALKWA